MQRVAMQGETPGNVDGIKTAELAYDSANNHYLALPPAPRPATNANSTAVDWPNDPAWTALGWRPDGRVRGVYQVTLTPTGFEVHGVCDVDDDGVQRQYTATETENATSKPGDEDVH